MKAAEFESEKHGAVIHERFGDLGRHDAVVLAGPGQGRARPLARKDFTYIHLSVTGRCQARCKGCINAAATPACSGDRRIVSPVGDTVPERDAACILNLLGTEATGEAAVCFYGGEPLLVPEKIVRIIEIIAAAKTASPVRYMLYTNGDLLGPTITNFPDLLPAIWLISVSIDGRKEQHEAVRPGTNLDRIRSGLHRLNRGRRGKVLVWSTLREEQALTDCFQEFLHLQSEGLADLFFWHWVETAAPYENFPAYIRCYEKELRGVMEYYLRWLSEGRILPVVHLNELLVFLLTGMARDSSACGVELAANFDLIDGRIHACADLPLEMAIGEIEPDGRPRLRDLDLSPLIAYKENLGCRRCGVHPYCGGRCPVQARISSPERLHQYCQLMRLHVGVVQEHLPAVAAELAAHGLTAQSLYDQAAFYAQFTDVTP